MEGLNSQLDTVKERSIELKELKKLPRSIVQKNKIIDVKEIQNEEMQHMTNRSSSRSNSEYEEDAVFERNC